MSFTEKSIKNTETNPEQNTGLLGKVMPFVPLLLEQFTGQPMKMSGTIGDILTILQRLETKLDNLEKDCSEQFIHQEQQLSSLQKISKLVSTEKTKAIHFTNTPKIQELDE
jgi:hypothetical protein